MKSGVLADDEKVQLTKSGSTSDRKVPASVEIGMIQSPLAARRPDKAESIVGPAEILTCSGRQREKGTNRGSLIVVSHNGEAFESFKAYFL
jgi:hypothetical protein